MKGSKWNMIKELIKSTLKLVGHIVIIIGSLLILDLFIKGFF